MTRWLLDTNVLSELHRRQPERQVKAFVDGCPLDRVFISTVTIAEIRCGIELLPGGEPRERLQRWLVDFVRSAFQDRTFEITEDILATWLLLARRGRKSGRTYASPDLLIAATAMEHGLLVVTRNVRDFAGLPVQLLNPWK